MRTGWKEGKDMTKEQERQYKPKIIRGKINIPYRDWKGYREEYQGQGFTVSDYKNMQKADQIMTITAAGTCITGIKALTKG